MKFFTDFYEKYLCLNVDDYLKLGFDLEINKLILVLSVGLCIACFYISFIQSNISLFLKKLIRSEAFSEEKSKTLGELGLSDNKTLRRLILKDSGVIKKAVSVLGIKKLTYEEYVEAEKAKKEAKKNKSSDPSKSVSSVNIDFNVAKFYIQQDNRAYADHAFTVNNSSIVKTLLYCVLILSFTLTFIFLMPSLLGAVGSIIS